MKRSFVVLVGLATLSFGCSHMAAHGSRNPSSVDAKRVLIVVPHTDFDPTEAAVPWKILKAAGNEITFATPDGEKASADPAEISGEGLGPLADVIRADANGREAYAELDASEEFNHPVKWSSLKEENFDAIYLPGGHSPGMQQYLRSELLQSLISDFFAANKPVGAICHGALLVARSTSKETGKSVLYGRKTTSLTNFLEMMGYDLTKYTGGEDADNFRTDPETVEDQVKDRLASPADYLEGPKSVLRDSPDHLSRGFYVLDGNYISARWPGDAFNFGNHLAQLIANYRGK